jgi:hypothetical protein
MIRILPRLPLLLLLPVAAHLQAQATPTAERSSDLSVFLEAEALHPDYGTRYQKGIIAGIDYTTYFHGFFVPSLEIRADYSPDASAVGEQVALGGLRLDLRPRSFPHLHPYANFLLGAGQIDYVIGVPTANGIYSRDNSVVYNYGAGLGVDLGHGLEAQAEFQHQNWSLGGGPSPYTLTPSSYNAGIRYHVQIPHLHRR